MRYLVKLFFILSCFLTLQPANASGPGTYTFYDFDTPGPFSNFDIYTTWLDAPASGVVNANIYPAFQFAFQNGGGYIGTQMNLNGTGRSVLFSIWDTAENSQTAIGTSSNCVRFGGEGTGAGCPIGDYGWVAGREYRLRVVSAGTDATGENWRGEIKDMVTGIETVLGVIHLANTPGYTGYGQLTGGLTFLEYFTATTCTGNPASKILWRGPYAENGLYGARYAYSGYNGCVNLNVATSTGKPTVTHEIGDSVQHTTAQGQELWNSPVVMTQPMTGSTPNCATLNATINTWGLASNLRFQYGATSAFGSTTADIPVTSTAATPVASTVCSLMANTTYYAQAVGTYNDPVKGVLTTYGETLQFTLDASGNIIVGSVIAAPPRVDSTTVSNIQGTTAALSATVNTNGSAGRVYAQCKTGTGDYTGYGLTPPIMLAQQPIKGRIIGFDITGLTPSTTYTCRIGAWNNGTESDTLGTPVSFNTLDLVNTTGYSNLLKTSATLSGTVNNNGSDGVLYGACKTGTGPYVNFGSKPIPATNGAVSVDLIGLAQNTSYSCHISTWNNTMMAETIGTPDVIFSTLLYDPPTVSPTEVSNIQQTTATLTATVNTNGGPGRAYAQCQTGTGEYEYANGITPSPQQPINGLVSLDISGLSAITAYTCRINAWNNGTDAETMGAPVSFTTLAYPPTVTTTGASNIQQTTATLSGTVNTNGDPSGGVYSQCKIGTGAYAAYGAILLSQPTNGTVSVAITGLRANKTYSCHLNAFGNHTGNVPDTIGTPDVTFKTLK